MSENKDKMVINKIKKLSSDYCNSLTKNEKVFITTFDYKTSITYGLPKVHKSQMIQEEIRKQKSDYIEVEDPVDLKFRPIIAGPECPTHRLWKCYTSRVFEFNTLLLIFCK